MTFRDVPGLTRGRLQQIVDCHLARNAVLGHDVPEMSYCPLVPLGAKAQVNQTPGGLTVEITADGSEAAQDVWRRAELLTGARP